MSPGSGVPHQPYVCKSLPFMTEAQKSHCSEDTASWQLACSCQGYIMGALLMVVG